MVVSPGRSGWRVALLVLALGQVVTPLVLTALGGGAFTSANRAGEPAIVPAGYAFSIWSVIQLLAVLYAVWALPAGRPDAAQAAGQPDAAQAAGQPDAAQAAARPSAALRDALARPDAEPPARRLNATLPAGRPDAAQAAARPSAALRDALARPLCVVFAGFSAWLVAAELEPVWTTLAILVAMVAGMLVAMRRALVARAEIRGWGRYGAGVLGGLLGLYLGWTSIAVWLNLTTALAGSGAPLDGPLGVGGQLAVLAGATATAVALVRWTRAQPAYVAAVLWAFVGAVVGAAGAGEPVLAAAAATGGVVVVAGTLLTVRRTRTPHAAG